MLKWGFVCVLYTYYYNLAGDALLWLSSVATMKLLTRHPNTDFQASKKYSSENSQEISVEVCAQYPENYM